MNKLSPFIFAATVSCAHQGSLEEPQAPTTIPATPQAPTNDHQSDPLPTRTSTTEFACSRKEKQKECHDKAEEILWKMADKLPELHVGDCLEQGEMDAVCVEQAYTDVIGEDEIFKRLEQVRLKCKADLEYCTEQ